MLDLNLVEPLQIPGLADYHVHCDYSIDASGTIEEYCQAAIKRGLVEICFTTHYDANPGTAGCVEFIRVDGHDLPVSPENLVAYVDHVRRAREQFFSRGLTVKLGVEFGWYQGCEDELARLRQTYDFDHVLCGLHEIENICFCCEERYQRCFERYGLTELVDRYVGELVAAAKSNLFTCLAHLDYLRRFGHIVYGSGLDEALLAKCQSDLFPVLAESSTVLEVNTSSVRRGLEPYFPRIALINAARRAGVDVHFLGSDAHRPEDIGYDFDVASALASQTAAGCDED